MLARQEVVERRGPFDLDAREVQGLGEQGDGLVGHAAVDPLHVAQHGQQLPAFAPVLFDDDSDDIAHRVDLTPGRAAQTRKKRVTFMTNARFLSVG